MSRTRRRNAFAASTFTAEPSAIAKADGVSPQTLLEAVAVGVTKLPALDTYWFLYQKHPTVGSCVDLIANSVSAGGYDVLAKGKGSTAATGAKEKTAPVIDDFFDVAFEDETFRGAMWALAVDMSVFPLGYWRKKRAGKLLVGLERIDPRLVLPKPNKDRTAIETFLVRKIKADENNVNSIYGSGAWNDAEPVSPDDMVFFKLPGGDKLLGAPSPLEHLDHTLGLDLAIRRHRHAFFKNGAVTGKIIGMKGATREQLRYAENQINNTKRGPENAYRTWVLGTGPNGDITIADRGNNTGEQEVDFLKGSNLDRDEILMVYHIPPGKILFSGAALGSSGKAEDDATYQTDCVLPLEEQIYEIINRHILVAEFGITDVELAPKRRSMLRLDMFPSANEGLQFGMTINESRDVAGLSKIDNPLCDLPVVLGARGQGLLADEPIEGATEPAAPAEGTPNAQASTDNAPGNKKPGAANAKDPKAKARRLERRILTWY